eukprot:CAMPEP_0204559946 /NCGR_PEP_ID=MMETSP0661-20131031/32324_1 /ASSEMBLY_ACC=CAM_ASM_000606 /TAXON_ID=109239 /ORGANISM="Alexandrium margalefi, Strain AMGDE01CS-322" /LENGTH=127 /DNA_ID=CAMNT_0051567225 /DNA_START=42 /DNA_END=425 /DNA_ORIENTATION=+
MARGLSSLILAAAALLALRACTQLFAAPSMAARPVARGGLRGRTALHAKEDIMAATPATADKLQEATGAFEFSTGARNEVSIITPEVDSESIKAWLSLNINFFLILVVMTAGGLIEIQRFFPDALFW